MVKEEGDRQGLVRAGLQSEAPLERPVLRNKIDRHETLFPRLHETNPAERDRSNENPKKPLRPLNDRLPLGLPPHLHRDLALRHRREETDAEQRREAGRDPIRGADHPAYGGVSGHDREELYT